MLSILTNQYVNTLMALPNDILLMISFFLISYDMRNIVSFLNTCDARLKNIRGIINSDIKQYMILRRQALNLTIYFHPTVKHVIEYNFILMFKIFYLMSDTKLNKIEIKKYTDSKVDIWLDMEEKFRPQNVVGIPDIDIDIDINNLIINNNVLSNTEYKRIYDIEKKGVIVIDNELVYLLEDKSILLEQRNNGAYILYDVFSEKLEKLEISIYLIQRELYRRLENFEKFTKNALLSILLLVTKWQVSAVEYNTSNVSNEILLRYDNYRTAKEFINGERIKNIQKMKKTTHDVFVRCENILSQLQI